MKEQRKKFKLKDFPGLIKESFKKWIASDPWRLSAIIAYYAILSLPALLVIIVNVIGAVWGAEIVEGELTREIGSVLGADSARSIQVMIAETQSSEKNLASTIIGIGTLLFGATGVFYQLQVSLNAIWNIESNPKSNIWRVVISRARGFAFILVVGFLLLISFIISTGISLFNSYIQSMFPKVVLYAAYILDAGISICIIASLFAFMFKYLPDAIISWRSVWAGGLLTALLFVIGQSVLSYYFAKADPGSTYGAAGSVILILLWVSYSCLILFFGAQFTWVFSKHYTQDITPTKYATKLNE